MLRKMNAKSRIREEQRGDFCYLTFPIYDQYPGLQHMFSTRQGGYSEGIFRSMNLSFQRGDDPEAVRKNFEVIASYFDTDLEHMVNSHQTHTTNIKIVTEQNGGSGILREDDEKDIDGLITNCKNIVLGCFFADCVPLYFYDPDREVLGVAHAGWRGTVNKMAVHMVQKMQTEFGCEPGNLVCAIGPSICQDCYEVSEDVAVAFQESITVREDTQSYYENMDLLLPGKEKGKYQLDLWLANFWNMLEAGIDPTKVQITDVCTCCNSDLLHSHRATGGKRGNLGAFAMLK